MYVPATLLCVFFTGVFFGGMVAIVLAFIMTVILGVGEGALTTSFQAIRGDIAKQYPELNSTYYALVISCLNFGHLVGYIVAAILLMVLSTIFTQFWIIFLLMMVVMAVFQSLSLLIFLTIDRKEYEFVKNLE